METSLLELERWYVFDFIGKGKSMAYSMVNRDIWLRLMLKIFYYIICVCACMCLTQHVPCWSCAGQRTSCGSCFSLCHVGPRLLDLKLILWLDLLSWPRLPREWCTQLGDRWHSSWKSTTVSFLFCQCQVILHFVCINKGAFFVVVAVVIVFL